jgi:hypothetical protein
MKRLEQLTRWHGGGGSSAPAAAIAAAPIPSLAPPVTENNAAVLQAEHDMASQNLLKKSIAKTIYAGDTGGYNPKNPAGAGPMAGYKAKI